MPAHAAHLHLCLLCTSCNSSRSRLCAVAVVARARLPTTQRALQGGRQDEGAGQAYWWVRLDEGQDSGQHLLRALDAHHVLLRCSHDADGRAGAGRALTSACRPADARSALPPREVIAPSSHSVVVMVVQLRFTRRPMTFCLNLDGASRVDRSPGTTCVCSYFGREGDPGERVVVVRAKGGDAERHDSLPRVLRGRARVASPGEGQRRRGSQGRVQACDQRGTMPTIRARVPAATRSGEGFECA